MNLLPVVIIIIIYLFIIVIFFFWQLISEEIAELQHNHATTMAKLAQFKRKHLELSHSILEVKILQYVHKTLTKIQLNVLRSENNASFGLSLLLLLLTGVLNVFNQGLHDLQYPCYTALTNGSKTSICRCLQWIYLAYVFLQVMIKQECLRKGGYSVQADEEQLRYKASLTYHSTPLV